MDIVGPPIAGLQRCLAADPDIVLRKPAEFRLTPDRAQNRKRVWAVLASFQTGIDYRPVGMCMRIAVTGAFGFSGRYVAKRLLEAGHEVITLTNSVTRRSPFGQRVKAFPFHFEQPEKLGACLRGVDALINNIAWSLRHFPVMGVFGSGDYRLQPIYVNDLARTAAQMASGERNEIVEAIGPETFSYRELVDRVGRAIGVRRPIVSVSPRLGYWSCRLVGLFVGDVVITREEIRGLMEGRLCVEAPPLGTTKLTEWMDRHRDTLGRRYTSEMARRIDREAAYRSN